MTTQKDGALGMAEAIGSAHREGLHGKPTWWVEELGPREAVLTVNFGGTEEYPPSAFEITVRQTKGDK